MSTLDHWRGVLTSAHMHSAFLEMMTRRDQHIGCFLEIGDNPADLPTPGTGILEGIPFAVKNNIAVNGFRLTCGSRILEHFISPYTATAVSRLQQAGGQVIATCNLDEFGMGSSTDTSALQTTHNPWNPEYVAGGSSGGSAAAVAAGMVSFALGSDTGGSVRQPAAFCGCYGLKPTYGTISRYGLVAYASSLESIGILTADVESAEVLYRIMAGPDEQDQSTVTPADISPKTRRIGVLTNRAGLSPAIARSYRETVTRLQECGFEPVEISLPMIDYVVPAYYTIATAEASANLARFTGVRYGLRVSGAESPDDMVRNTRNSGFGDEVKLRILLGTYVLRSGFQDQYYIRAQKIRTAIRNGFDRLFDTVDLILAPVYPTQAFRHGDSGLSPFQQKLADHFTAIANLAGIPAMAFPTGVIDGLPVGLQLLGPAFGEQRIFDALRQITGNQPCPTPPGMDDQWRRI